MVLPSWKQNPSVFPCKCCLINLLREQSRHLLINTVKLFLTNNIIFQLTVVVKIYESEIKSKFAHKSHL